SWVGSITIPAHSKPWECRLAWFRTCIGLLRQGAVPSDGNCLSLVRLFVPSAVFASNCVNRNCSGNVPVDLFPACCHAIACKRPPDLWGLSSVEPSLLHQWCSILPSLARGATRLGEPDSPNSQAE